MDSTAAILNFMLTSAKLFYYDTTPSSLIGLNKNELKLTVIVHTDI